VLNKSIYVCVYFKKQELSGSPVPGVGTSLVLTQTEIVFGSRYPRHRHRAAISHLVPYLGSSVAQFAMPLLMLGFLSVYGTRGAPLLQAGLVLQGLVGAVVLRHWIQRTPPISRYHSRPRAFTFVNDESNSYFKDRCDFNYTRTSRAVFLNRRVTSRYRALASIIPGRERFSWNLSF
jgi:hypothetical protein